MRTYCGDSYKYTEDKAIYTAQFSCEYQKKACDEIN